MDAFMTFAMPPISLILFAVPALLISSRLPRRSNFELRVAFGCAAMLVFFVLFKPKMSLSSLESIPVDEFISTAVFFSATLALMGLFVFSTRDVSPIGACYCAVVAYTVENLGASLAELIGLVRSQSAEFATIDYMLRMLFMCLAVYLVVYLIMEHKNMFLSSTSGRSEEPSIRVFVLLLTVILVSIVFDMGIKRLPALGLQLSYTLLFRITQIVMCASILTLEYELLYSRNMKIQAATTERLLRDREKQYELSRDTIEAVNIKMHDIRHQIRHLEDGSEGMTVLDRDMLREIARGVNVYDSTVKTGNEALDTILTEKTLLGSREGISLSCIVDGSALDFMSPTDLYSLFGNALDNAFDAVRQLEDKEKRNISLLVRRIANMASIHIENYFEGEISYDASGNPMSSKLDKESHGYGVRSMRLICERYGGTLTLTTEGQTFSANILIPIP